MMRDTAFFLNYFKARSWTILFLCHGNIEIFKQVYKIFWEYSHLVAAVIESF